MNESTFEANLDNELKRIFPSFLRTKITHQKIFKLKLGHHKIQVDGSYKYGEIGGRLDVLLEIDKKPMAVLELKRPGEKLSLDDRDQGISYARLLDCMPPLVIVSNGSETIFYKTHDKTKWEPKELNELTIQSLFKNALSVAANELDDAVRFLISEKPNIWEKVLRQYTDDILKHLVGDIEDFSYPICKDFSVNRDVISEIIECINDGEKFIALVGAPLSGKTNAIYQLCLSNDLNDIVPVYVDASSISYGILQYIANQFSMNFLVNTDKEDIRKWIINGLRQSNGKKLVIIIDGWSIKVKDEILNDLQELIELAQNSNISIVISVDDSIFNEISYMNGRETKSKIGHLMKKINIDRINDNEFQIFQDYMLNKYNAIFYEGAKYNLQYRNPGILRILASEIYRKNKHIKLVKNNNTVLAIPSVTNINILEAVWEKFTGDVKLRNDMQSLVKAYMSDSNIKYNPELRLLSYGKSYISYETIEDKFSEDKIERLILQGYIELINGPKGTGLVLVKVPELFAASASYFILKEMEKIIYKGQFDEAYKYLINECEFFPFSDLIGAKVIFELSRENDIVLTEIVERLLNDIPKAETKHGKIKFLVQSSKLKVSKISVDEGEEHTIISNTYPWLILSQLACYPIGTNNGNRSIHFRILSKIGSFRELLRIPENNPVEAMEGFHYHYRKNIGNFLCGKVGIVESIVHAMQNAFFSMPKEMINLCNFAVNDSRHFLAWRLNKAASSLTTCNDINVINTVDKAIEILEPIVNVNCKLYEPLKRNRINRNDLCPCGSGRKFKQCCSND